MIKVQELNTMRRMSSSRDPSSTGKISYSVRNILMQFTE